MYQAINNLVEKIEERLRYELEQDTCESKKVTMLLLRAYNKFQEDERDGVDYIFDITSWDDVKCCADGGMTTKEFNDAFNKYMNGKYTQYFQFGYDRKNIELFGSMNDIREYLKDRLDLFIRQMLYHHDREEYAALYDFCISDYMMENGLHD